MGTRADFYIEENQKLNWLGSVSWDGYDVYKSDYQDKNYASSVKFSKTKEEFIEALSQYASIRDDWTTPDEGWPWPWHNSHTTDMAYVFRDGKVDCYIFGESTDGRDEHGEYPNGEPPKDERFPDMSAMKNVKDAGFLVLRVKQ